MAFNISWDAEADRRYELGTDRGVLYPFSSGAYEDGVAWNGLTSVEEAPSGADANDIWADNMKYATLRSAEQFGFTIEAYTYPSEFEQCDGCATALSDKSISIGQQPRKKFGFSFRSDIGDATEDTVDPDSDYKLHIIWAASASPSSRSYETINDSPDAMTMSWECTSTPVKFNDSGCVNAGLKPVCHMTIDKDRFITGGTGTVNNTLKGYFEKLEETLYGKPNTAASGQPSNAVAAKLPSPDEVIRILKTGNINTPTTSIA